MLKQRPTGARKKKADSRRPDLDTVFTINEDGSRNFLHPADVRGRFQLRKNITFAALILIYAVVPWIEIGGHPAVHIDLPNRAAYIAGLTFTNQDFYLLFFLVSGVGFVLFVVTSLWGRIWCGYACPQTVFMEGVYRRFERWIEGPRDTRIRRNLGPWTADKTVRKVVKHAVFLVLSFVIAHVFVAYFIPPRDLLAAMVGPPREHWTAFLWVAVWTAILYFDYAWFREQTCLIICPYGRTQSALVDADTLVIGYDEARGEPRSKKSEEGGDCIDCFRCVAVCPTGIDIRNGMQMECIGCANCIDACDEIMERTGRPHGLVRYDSQHGFEEGKRRGLVRPRSIVYAALALVGVLVFVVSISGRTSFEVRVLRTVGMPYVIDEQEIRNVFNLKVQNKRDDAAVFYLEVSAAGENPPELVLATPTLRVGAMADATTMLIARIPRGDWSVPIPITVTVADSASGSSRDVKLTFRGP